jgi:hypothetical protein
VYIRQKNSEGGQQLFDTDTKNVIILLLASLPIQFIVERLELRWRVALTVILVLILTF